MVKKVAKRYPISMMVRGSLEYALSKEALDDLFRTTATHQYEKELLFSSVVDLMSMVVARVHPSLHSAYRSVEGRLPVSLTALYDKVNGLEPELSAALVAHVAQRLKPVLSAMPNQEDKLIEGVRVRVLDGNHLAATERRLDVLKQSWAGPLPGQALVFYDLEDRLISCMIPCEDGHAQERSMTDKLLLQVQANDCIVADRNFCTWSILNGICTKQAYFVIRQHANLAIVSEGTLRKRGRRKEGEIFEQSATLQGPDGQTQTVRKIVVRLDAPTRNQDAEIVILTNLPKSLASAVKIADLYRKRWSIEVMFFELTQMLDGELNTLGYPRAALLGFAIALVSYNILSIANSALRSAHGNEKIDREVSKFYLANEVRASSETLDIVSEEKDWIRFEKMYPDELAEELISLAKTAELWRYQKSVRREKKPVPKRTKHRGKPHISTAKVLIASRGRTTP